MRISDNSSSLFLCHTGIKFAETPTNLFSRQRKHVMAKFPFDKKFQLTVQNLPDWGDEAWDTLLNYSPTPDGPIFESLGKLGYSSTTVMAYLAALRELPIQDLIDLAITDDLDTSPALNVLQHNRSRDVLDSAIALCKSGIAKERAVGVLVLMGSPGFEYPEEASEAVSKLLDETDDEVMCALAYAVRHLNVANCTDLMQRAAQSGDSKTRFAAAFAFGGLNDEIAIQAMIALSKDADDDVRDWATFGLHLGLEDEQKARQDIRDAFYARLTDPHEDTRYEAIEGLARCKDTRVLEPLIAALESDTVRHMVIEAAGEMAHPELYLSLIKLKQWWNDSDESGLLDQAIANCRPQP